MPPQRSTGKGLSERGNFPNGNISSLFLFFFSIFKRERYGTHSICFCIDTRAGKNALFRSRGPSSSFSGALVCVNDNLSDTKDNWRELKRSRTVKKAKEKRRPSVHTEPYQRICVQKPTAANRGKVFVVEPNGRCVVQCLHTAF